MRLNNKQGFTLIELAVVIAIVGVLSALGVSGLQKAVLNDRARSAADELLATFNEAAAIARQRADSLCLVGSSTGNGLVLLVYNTAGKKCNGDTIKTYTLEKGTIEKPPRLEGLMDSLDIDDEYGPSRDWSSNANGSEALFVPRPGQNPIATQGYIGVKINDSRRAAVGKGAFANYFQAFVCFSCDDDWGGPWWVRHR